MQRLDSPRSAGQSTWWYPTFEPRGSAFGIMKNGRKALTEIDASLWTDLEKVGVIMPIGGLVLPWWEMRDALLRKVRQTANIELLVGQVLTNIHDHGDTIDSSNGNGGIDAHFESGMTLSADFLVAADGVHSVVRELLGLAPAIDTGARVFRGSLTVTETSSDKLKVLLQGGIVPMGNLELEGVYFIVFNFHSKHPGRMTWAFSTPMTLLRQEVTNETELELLQEIFDSSDSRHLKPFPPTKVVDFSDEALSIHGGGWGGRSRVTLTGDAAHAW